jgi:hypothetical protein
VQAHLIASGRLALGHRVVAGKDGLLLVLSCAWAGQNLQLATCYLDRSEGVHHQQTDAIRAGGRPCVAAGKSNFPPDRKVDRATLRLLGRRPQGLC